MLTIERLIHELAKLPGVGPRSARRLALNLLRQKTQRIPTLVAALTAALEQVKNCSICGSLDETDPCQICSDEKRDASIVCVVEDVADVWAMERARSFKGHYHVLGGTLSAMDGRGPDALRIHALLARVKEGTVREIILALSATVAGQTTAHYVAERVNALAQNTDGSAADHAHAVATITKLAHGIPMGAELDYMDDGTLSAALNARLAY